MRRWTLLLLCFCVLAACRDRDAPSELDRYRHAALEPGLGLGDLRLGQLTLAAAVSRFGAARVAILASDVYGFELMLANGGLALMFETGEDDACKRAAMQRGARELSRGLADLLAAEPACRSLALATLTVRDGFYRGRTSGGIGMGDGLVASSIGSPGDNGTGTALPRYFAEGGAGITFYSSREPGPEDAPIEAMVIFRPAR